MTTLPLDPTSRPADCPPTTEDLAYYLEPAHRDPHWIDAMRDQWCTATSLVEADPQPVRGHLDVARALDASRLTATVWDDHVDALEDGLYIAQESADEDDLDDHLRYVWKNALAGAEDITPRDMTAIWTAAYMPEVTHDGCDLTGMSIVECMGLALVDDQWVDAVMTRWCAHVAEATAAVARQTPTLGRIRGLVEGVAAGTGLDAGPWGDGYQPVSGWVIWQPLPDGAVPGTEPGEMTLADRGALIVQADPDMWYAYVGDGDTVDGPDSPATDEDVVGWLEGLLAELGWVGQDQEGR